MTLNHLVHDFGEYQYMLTCRLHAGKEKSPVCLPTAQSSTGCKTARPHLLGPLLPLKHSLWEPWVLQSLSPSLSALSRFKASHLHLLSGENCSFISDPPWLPAEAAAALSPASSHRLGRMPASTSGSSAFLLSAPLLPLIQIPLAAAFLAFLGSLRSCSLFLSNPDSLESSRSTLL